MHELEMLTGPALGGLLKGGAPVAVVPFGSIEHHGGHLPLRADAPLADVVGRDVARELRAGLPPTGRVGCAEPHRRAAGTLALRAGTLEDVAVELAEDLARQGFGLIVLVSTHGGNRAALEAAVARLSPAPGGAVVCAPAG